MKTRNLFPSAIACLLVLWLVQPSAQAQRALTGTNYTEGFESIAGGSLPAGWTCRFNASATAVGDEIPFDNGISSWSGATIGLPYNMASVFNIDPATSGLFNGTESESTQNDAADRAPGQRLSSSTDGETTWTLQIADTLGFSDFTVSVDLLVLTANARTGVWTVDYAVGDAPVSFTPLATLGDIVIDGTNYFGAVNSGVLTIPADADNQGQNLWIRLANLTDTAPSGARDTYGIDNFVLAYTGGVVSMDPPSIVAQPQSATNQAGETAILTVDADGAPILVYQWRKDGTNLGAPSLASLSLPEIVTADAGDYDVVIANAYGAITSAVARLTVAGDPGLVGSVASQTNVPGDVIRVTIDVAGTLPKTFQWMKDGVAVPGASGSLTTDVQNTVGYTITTNATEANEGVYRLVVSNPLGAITGTVANVVVMDAPSTRLAAWDFNSLVNDADTATGVDTPYFGSGSLFLAPLTTLFEWRGGANTDPADLDDPNDNSAYRARGVNTDFNLESGVEVRVDTTGYQDILVSWRENHNTRASRYTRFQYATDGVNFTDAASFSFADRDGSWLLLTQGLAGLPDVNDNPDFAFRIVAEWESTAIGTANDAYVAAATGSSFSAANGVMIFDQLTVWGNVLGSVAPIVITDLRIAGGSVVVNFSSGPSDSPGNFTLLNASALGGTNTDAGAAISEVGPGSFEANTAVGGSQEYYYLSR